LREDASSLPSGPKENPIASPQKPVNVKRIILRLVAFSISIISLVWIVQSFDLAELWQAMQRANYWFLLPIIVLMVLSLVGRSIRWGTLFAADQSPQLKELFGSMMIGYLANNILPARAGDLVRAYSLGTREGIAKSTVLATVVVERVADLVITLILLGAAFLFFPLPDWSQSVGIVLALMSLAAIGLLIALNLAGTRLLQTIVRLLRFLPRSVLSRIEGIGEGFVRGVVPLREAPRVLRFLGLSGMIWLVEVAITFMMAKAFDLPLGFGESLFVLLVIALGMAIPSAPGFIGTYEFFGASALMLLGIAGGEALGFLLVLHATTFLGSSIIGAYCLAFQSSGRIPSIETIEAA
jgi:uncharacterized protein (TIRG00374 family)